MITSILFFIDFYHSQYAFLKNSTLNLLHYRYFLSYSLSATDNFITANISESISFFSLLDTLSSSRRSSSLTFFCRLLTQSRSECVSQSTTWHMQSQSNILSTTLSDLNLKFFRKLLSTEMIRTWMFKRRVMSELSMSCSSMRIILWWRNERISDRNICRLWNLQNMITRAMHNICHHRCIRSMNRSYDDSSWREDLASRRFYKSFLWSADFAKHSMNYMHYHKQMCLVNLEETFQRICTFAEQFRQLRKSQVSLECSEKAIKRKRIRRLLLLMYMRSLSTYSLLIYMRFSSTYSLLNASKSFMISEIRQEKLISVSITKAQSAFSQVTISRSMLKIMCALKIESSLKAMQQSSERMMIDHVQEIMQFEIGQKLNLLWLCCSFAVLIFFRRNSHARKISETVLRSVLDSSFNS